MRRRRAARPTPIGTSSPATTTGARPARPATGADPNSPTGTGYYPDGTNYNVTIDNAGSDSPNLNVSVTLNSLTILDGAGLNMSGTSLTAGTINLQGSGGISGNGTIDLTSPGLLAKDYGTNVSVITPTLYDTNGSIQVGSGVLVLAGGGSLSNTPMVVSNGAAVDLSGTWSGQVTGTGGGKVQMAGGVLTGNPGLTLDLPPGMFQWTNGTLAGSISNAGAMTLSGSNSILRGAGGGGGGGTGTMVNAGVMVQTNGADLGIGWTGSTLQNAGRAGRPMIWRVTAWTSTTTTWVAARRPFSTITASWTKPPAREFRSSARCPAIPRCPSTIWAGPSRWTAARWC